MDIKDVQNTMNRAADAIGSHVRLPEEGTVDAINLMINATIYWLTPGNEHGSLRDVVKAMYDEETTLEDIVRWISQR